MALLTRVDKKTLAKCVKCILPMLETPVQSATTTDYLTRFCSHLDLPTFIRNAASTVVQRATDMGLMAGKSPLSIAAAAIFLVTRLSDHPKTEREISPVAGVAEATIKHAYKDMWYADAHARKVWSCTCKLCEFYYFSKLNLAQAQTT